MPATESTWRDQKKMHFFFGITGVILFFATIWMFQKDHDRQWKGYQSKAKEIQVLVDRWKEESLQTVEHRREHDRLQSELVVVRSQGFEPALLAEFQESVKADSAIRDDVPPEFTAMDSDFANLEKLAGEASAARQQADAAKASADELEKVAATALIDADNTERDLKAATEEAKKAELKLKLETQKAKLDGAQKAAAEARTKANDLNREALSAELAAGSARTTLLDRMRVYLKEAKFREDLLSQQRKFKNANLDKAKADEGLGVRDSLPKEQMDKLEAKIHEIDAEVNEYTLRLQAATEHRKTIQRVLKTITASEDAVVKKLELNNAALVALEKAIEQKRITYVVWWNGLPTPGKKLLEAPILSAFNSPLKIENLWSDGLTIDYNFRDVKRYDRCTTCHQLMEKSQPGQADKPGFVKERLLTLILTPPSKEKLEELQKAAAEAGQEGPSLEDVFGLSLVNGGLVDRNAISVINVVTDSLGTQARLKLSPEASKPMPGNEIRDSLLKTSTDDQQRYDIDDPSNPFAPTGGFFVGDVFVDVDGNIVRSRAEAERFLLEGAKAQRPLHVLIRRGLANPFTSHPRLDLFVGGASPHKQQDFACTICHEGQGSATDFKWASHTPNNVEQSKQWVEDYGWFDNHHWIYPMNAKRFVEASCLKCHQNVVELEASEQFPETPAPKVTRGYNLIRKYGCYGCHEINGFDGPDKRIGPDLRLEPNVFAAAQQLKNDLNFEKLSSDERGWIETLIQHPDRMSERERVLEMLTADKAETEKRLGADTHELLSLFKAPEVPGTLRKPGPSLRFSAEKLDPAFMYDWIANPKNFRESTRMPRVFGLWDHLQGEGLHVAETYEPIEILSISTYLQGRSQKFEYLTPPAEVKAEPSIARGKTQFQTRGCVACHSHTEFKDAEQYRDPHEIVQGPDLSNLAQKFDPTRNPDGKKWLYSWIKEPTRYHVRTVMPNLFLDPIEGPNMVSKEVDGAMQEVAEGAPVLTDPVSDIVAFLTSTSPEQKREWAPVRPEPSKLDKAGEEALHGLMLEYLKDAFSIKSAEVYAEKGIPAARINELKGAERELVVADGQTLTAEQKLTYLGRKSISKYGCYGCHDIPGFEDSKPIGAGLSDWGRKDAGKLAFEHILEYLAHGHHGPMGGGHGNTEKHAEKKGEEPATPESEMPEENVVDHAAHGHAPGEHPLGATVTPPYFMAQLNAGNRIGFLYQKLTAPRSYDWMKTENKKYNDRLRMPLFPFNEADREAVMTFVLGLVADPPEPKYVFQPDERRLAIIEGQKVLDTFNCQSCHILRMEQMGVAFPPEHFGKQMTPEDQALMFPFLMKHFTPEAIEASQKKDRRGLHQATVRGMPQLAADGRPYVTDPEQTPVEGDEPFDTSKLVFNFDLWQPVVFSGETFLMGVKAVPIESTQIQQRHAAHGGFLTRYLLPVVTKLEGNGKGKEAMAWLPPPLIGEGEKVQSAWLHEFLLEPYPIRPAVFLRMPKFNMTSADATKLAKYFAAVDGVEHPYVFNGTRQYSYLNSAENEFHDRLQRLATPEKPLDGTRLDHAMNIVVSGNYCVKCHIVGDYAPEGEMGKKPSPQGLAPDLSRVYSRLRPTYIREWIAKPTSKLPYTSMPVNIKFDANGAHLGDANDQKVLQELFPGTSIEQVDGLVDLLMNFDQYAKGRSSVRAIVPKPPAAAETTEAKPDQN